MSRNLFALVLSCGVLAAGAAVAQQAPPPGMPVFDPAMMARMQAAEARARSLPDTPGSGPYPAIKEEVASLPDHVVYRPHDLSALGPRKLGVIVWGNGGCGADGAAQRFHLSELASHGYLVIANGRILSGPGVPPPPPPPAPKPGEPFKIQPPATSPEQLQAIDWAVAENGRSGSAYAGHIDTKAIAVSGWSCGGVQALRIATSDPRIKAVVIDNSGLFPPSAPKMPGMELGKDALDRLHTPILYILGGPSDIAYANGMDDYAQIAKVPAAIVNIGNVGHGGTFLEPNGGKAAQIALAWFEWRLRGDAAAGRMFTGAQCGLCSDTAVTLLRKRF